jgi:bifunctional non-homologous end joining protein LigD
MNLSGTSDIAHAMKRFPVVYYCFDLLYADGYQLLRTPLINRTQTLRVYMNPDDRVRYSDHVRGDGLGLFELARGQDLEGIIAKHIQSPYEMKRSKWWVKLKTVLQQEAVVVGFTEPQGQRKYFGSLLLGVYDKSGKKLDYVGHVGTGFDSATLKTLYDQLKSLVVEKPPVKGGPHRGVAHWVEPKMVVEVKFAQWTPDGKMRVPVFLGVRTDKEAKECIRET